MESDIAMIDDRITNDNSLLSLAKTSAPEALNTFPWRRESVVENVQTYVSASLAESTRRAYSSDLRHFASWGGTIPASGEVLAAYLADHANTLSPFTLQRRLSAIKLAHDAIKAPHSCGDRAVRLTMRGIRRVHGTAQRQVAPLLREDVLSAVDALATNTAGLRDRALILLGFATAMRRSELVALHLDHLAFVSDGLVVRLVRSKTDQEGEGRDIAVPFARSRACPVKALRAWIDHARIETGPVFRSVGKAGAIGSTALAAQSVALIVKRAGMAIGLPAAEFAGHSLRAGFVTSAARLGISSWKIKAQTGHRSEEMLARYIRKAELFVDNAAGELL